MATYTAYASKTTNYFGRIYGSNATYATARSTSTGTTLTLPAIGQNYTSSAFNVNRTYLTFDTSFLGVGATITRAYLRLTVASDSSDTDFDVEIIKADWANELSSSGEANYDLGLSATKDVTWRNTSGIVLNTQYDSPDLDTTYINKTGNTRYALVSSRDIAGTAPAAINSRYEYITLVRQDQATGADRATLVIEATGAIGPKVYISQAVVEVPYTIGTAPNNLRVSQAVVEAPYTIGTAPLNVRVSQAVVEAPFGLLPVISSITPNPTTQGTEVTITGANFLAARGTGVVTFYNGKNPGAYTSWADGQIVCNVPNDAVTGNVTVTNDYGWVSSGYPLTLQEYKSVTDTVTATDAVSKYRSDHPVTDVATVADALSISGRTTVADTVTAADAAVLDIRGLIPETVGIAEGLGITATIPTLEDTASLADDVGVVVYVERNDWVTVADAVEGRDDSRPIRGRGHGRRPRVRVSTGTAVDR